MAKTTTPKAPKTPKPAAPKTDPADGSFKVMPLHGEKAAKSSG